MQQFLSELQKRGQSINPDVQITPERVAEFMRQAQSDIGTFMPYAEKEILPYYETQLKLAREGFLTSLGYSQQELLQNEQDLERKYQKNIQQIGEQAAERGFALSGGRQKEERETAEEAQRQVGFGRQRFGLQTGEKARQFAQTYGTAQLPTPTISAAPKVGLEGFERRPEQEAVYTLSPEVYEGLIGSEEFAKRGALRGRAAEIEGAFRESEALKQYRQLTL